MSSGKVKIIGGPLEGDYLLNQNSSAKALNDPPLKRDDLTQIMLISEQFNHNFKYVNLQPLDEDLKTLMRIYMISFTTSWKYTFPYQIIKITC